MNHAAELLLETARRGELHHSIILHGPVSSQLGEIATALAKALNCENGSTGDGCASCGKIDRGFHPDVHRIVVEENRKLIAVEQIRQMVSEATLRPYEGKAKVFIVDPADAISTAGANAMLKTLEEPTRGTVFILITRSADLLLPTIRSRSQAIAIQPLFQGTSREEAGRLGVSVQGTRLRRIALAFPALESDEADALTRALLDSIARFSEKRDFGALLGGASAIVNGAEPAAALFLMATLLRDLAALDPGDTLDPSRTIAIRNAIPRRAILEAAETALRNATRLNVNADSRLLAEQALLQLAKD